MRKTTEKAFQFILTKEIEKIERQIGARYLYKSKTHSEEIIKYKKTER